MARVAATVASTHHHPDHQRSSVITAVKQQTLVRAHVHALQPLVDEAATVTVTVTIGKLTAALSLLLPVSSSIPGGPAVGCCCQQRGVGARRGAGAVGLQQVVQPASSSARSQQQAGTPRQTTHLKQ